MTNTGKAAIQVISARPYDGVLFYVWACGGRYGSVLAPSEPTAVTMSAER